MAGRMPTIAQVQEAVAREFGVDESEMHRKRGNLETAHKRHAAIALSVLLTQRHLTTIGRCFGGIDHSSVIYANKAVARRRREDPELHAKMRRVTLDLLREGVGE